MDADGDFVEVGRVGDALRIRSDLQTCCPQRYSTVVREEDGGRDSMCSLKRCVSRSSSVFSSCVSIKVGAVSRRMACGADGVTPGASRADAVVDASNADSGNNNNECDGEWTLSFSCCTLGEEMEMGARWQWQTKKVLCSSALPIHSRLASCAAP